jgi:predicted DNA-binding protein
MKVILGFLTFIRYLSQKIGKPRITFIRYLSQKIGKPRITFIRYLIVKRLESLE